VYPVESHIAEKLHAYTLPRASVNSRVKDLPDIALLGKVRQLDKAHVRRAIEQTFGFRKTHPVSSSLPDPPGSWMDVYRRIAQEDDLEWRTLPELVAAVRAFIDPVLGSVDDARWSPMLWKWL